MTIEDHPHMAGKHASIHPCRHGAVMKKIIDVLVSRGGNPEVDKYDSCLSVFPNGSPNFSMKWDLGGVPQKFSALCF